MWPILAAVIFITSDDEDWSSWVRDLFATTPDEPVALVPCKEEACDELATKALPAPPEPAPAVAPEVARHETAEALRMMAAHLETGAPVPAEVVANRDRHLRRLAVVLDDGQLPGGSLN